MYVHYMYVHYMYVHCMYVHYMHVFVSLFMVKPMPALWTKIRPLNRKERFKIVERLKTL